MADLTPLASKEPLPILELKSVCKAFADARKGAPVPAVDRVSVLVPAQAEGEFVVLLGPSGCGKSTILQMISGMMPADSGEVHVCGEHVKGPSGMSVMVPQAYTCFPWLTVRGNVEFGLRLKGGTEAEWRKTAGEYITKVGLGDRADAFPKQLSGGMQQRVAIARTLAMRPKVVLMDEPFGALDAQTRAEMQRMLLELWEQERNMVLFVTHDITEALLLADRILVFSSRPARIIHDLRVPFARPRAPGIVYDSQFINLSQALLELLKHPAEKAEPGTTA